MEIYKINNLNFKYPNEEQNAISDLSLTVGKGDFLVLCGPSGCGKSTLLRHLKTVLTPYGEGSGEILFAGEPIEHVDKRIQTAKIGFVSQSPDQQIVTDKVWHELAFGLESLGYDTATIRGRVAEMASFFGIEDWFYKNVNELSGGQKQLLNLASVMTMQPEVLILDEPTAQLDPIAAGEFLSVLSKINREIGTTVMLSEHRLEETLPLATVVAVMEKGKILCSGSLTEIGKQLKDHGSNMFLGMPTPMRVWSAVDGESHCPVTIAQGRRWLEDYGKNHTLSEPPQKAYPTPDEKIAIKAEHLWFRYEKDAPDIVKGLDLEIRKGEFFALMGGNGTGKTTALKLLSGVKKPYRGKVSVQGKITALPQNPQTLFVEKTVERDLFEIFSGRDIPKEKQKDMVSSVVKLCRLDHLLDRHPFDLSGGEQQRAALAKVLLTKPDILLLDEPTKGFDAEFKILFAHMLDELVKKGMTVFMVSHDVEFCARYAHRCALFFDGSIVTSGTPEQFFSENCFYTTSAVRMSIGMIKGAITPEDIIVSCGGDVGDETLDSQDFDFVTDDKISEDDEEARPKETAAVCVTEKDIIPRAVPKSEKNRQLSKRTMVAAALILVAIPLTLYFGLTHFSKDEYYFLSFCILLECMLPFFMIYEGRKPMARELVVIAVLCAIGVAGRAAFYMLPQFKPVAALTIISGVALGGETGFLVGAMTMLISNMIFSQGPWTPWQMFAMGIIGFLAGVIFQKEWIRKNKVWISVFGAVAVMVVYGGIVNFSSALLAGGAAINLKIIAGYYVSGFSMDLLHAAATFVFLWFGAEPILEKLDRIKVKYGLME